MDDILTFLQAGWKNAGLGGEIAMNEALVDRSPFRVRLTPLKITLIYVLVGSLWILFSDQLTAVFVGNPTLYIHLQTAKGWFYVLVTATMLYLLIHHGISALHRSKEMIEKSEKKFRDLVENSLTGISIIQDDQIVYQNPEQERLFGRLPRVSKLKDFGNIHPDDIEKVKDFNQRITSGKVQTLDTDFRFYVRDTIDNRVDIKWAYCRATLTEYQGKNVIIENIMDISRIKELEHLLRIQDKMTSLGRVAAGIAHEIRNPLSGINIYLNTLAKLYDKGENPERLKEILGKVQSASNKIESVVRRVMDFSKPSAPQFVLKDINRPIEDAIGLSSVTLRKRDIKIEKDLAEDLPMVHADPQLIEQVVLNLITNAAEAMKNVDGAKQIKVTSSAENNRILVRISDSGPGVPLNLREKIFDPFYTTKSEGTGIGLSLSHRTITDHGGSLSVFESKWGGAEFVIDIPIAKPDF